MAAPVLFWVELNHQAGRLGLEVCKDCLAQHGLVAMLDSDEIDLDGGVCRLCWEVPEKPTQKVRYPAGASAQEYGKIFEGAMRRALKEQANWEARARHMSEDWLASWVSNHQAQLGNKTEERFWTNLDQLIAAKAKT